MLQERLVAAAAPAFCPARKWECMSTVETPAKPATRAPAPQSPIVVVDLGRRSKKQIKRLRKGDGRLMDRVEQTVGQLKADQEIDPKSEVVVVVVKQKDKGRKGLFGY
jgi:hypothetical protein